jgi:HSP20 family protein
LTPGRGGGGLAMEIKRRTPWSLIALLAATSAAQGYYIYQDQARKDHLERREIPFKDFDDLFDDRFFGRRFDPFAEMRELEKRFQSEFGETKTAETDKEVIVELSIPGLDKDSLIIDVNESRIRIAYDARRVQDRKDAGGRRVMRSESSQHFEKILPVPENADGRSSRIEREGGAVKIIFPRRERGIEADA